MPCAYCSTQFSNRQLAQLIIQSSTAVRTVQTGITMLCQNYKKEK